MLAGLGLLVGGVYHIVQLRAFLETSVAAEGRVVDLQAVRGESRIIKTKVRFETRDGRTAEFLDAGGPFPTDYRVGAKVPVKYNPQQPSDARIDERWSLWGGPVLFVLIGGLISLLFAVYYAFRLYRACLGLYLRYYGIRVQATLLSVETPHPVRLNDFSPYRITSYWRDPQTGTKHNFQKGWIWLDLSNYVPEKEIAVYIKRGDPGTYHMELGFLKKRFRSFFSGRAPDVYDKNFASRAIYYVPLWCWPVIAHMAFNAERYGISWLNPAAALWAFALCNLPLIHAWLKGKFRWIEAWFVGWFLPFLAMAVLMVMAT